MAYKWYVPVVIATGATGLSAAYDFGGGHSRMGVVLDANWVDGGTTKPISYQVAATADGTYYDLYTEAGVEVHSHHAKSRAYSIDTQGKYLAPFRYVKVRSGQTGAAVDQTNSPTLYFWFMR